MKNNIQVIVKNKTKNKLYSDVIFYCRSLGLQVKTEYAFLKGRRYRFDICIPELKLAIEYEGIVAYKSRHTSITGYSNDTIKYNLAVAEGWTVLRYTALTVNNAVGDITAFIKAKKILKKTDDII